MSMYGELYNKGSKPAITFIITTHKTAYRYHNDMQFLCVLRGLCKMSKKIFKSCVKFCG